MGLGFACIVVLLASAAIVGHGGQDARVQPGISGPDGSPLADGRETTLDAASKAAGFPVLRPSTELASDSSVSQVWVRDSWAPEIFVRYEGSIDLMVEEPDYSGSPEDFYKAQQDQGVPGEIIDLSGVAVFAVKGGSVSTKDPSTSGPPSITMVVDGLSVTLVGYGPDVTLDDLESAAMSVVVMSREVV